MTASQEFNKARAMFMDRVDRPEIPGNAVKLAHLIGFRHMDCKTQSTWAISQETLRKELGVKTIRTVQNLLRILEACGLKIEHGRGRGLTATYRIGNSPAATLRGAKKAKSDSPFNGPEKAKSAAEKGEIERPKKAKCISPPLKKISKIGEGEPNGSPFPVERENALRAQDFRTAGAPATVEADPDLFAQAEPPRTIPNAEPAAAPQDPTRGEDPDYSEPGSMDPHSRQQDPSAGRGVVAIADELAWRQLREIWKRGWASDDSARSIAITRQAFDRACALVESGGPAIVEAATVWIEAADAPHFLPRLADWLAAQGYAKPPPAKVKRGSGGRAARRKRWRWHDPARTGFKLAGWIEDADGNLTDPETGQVWESAS